MSTSKDILVLDKHYQPHDWMKVQDAIIAEAKGHVIERLGTKLFVYRGGTNRMGIESRIETNSILVISGLAPYKAHKAPSLTNSALFQRDRFICAYCGNKFHAHGLTRDHVHPRSKWNWTASPQGPDTWMNVVSACKGCNSLKDDVVPGHKLPKDSNGRQILGPQGTGVMDPLYVPYVPCPAEAMIMRNRNIKADQMEFLLARVQNRKSRIFDYARDLYPDL